jgi:hypothetical protein
MLTLLLTDSRYYSRSCFRDYELERLDNGMVHSSKQIDSFDRSFHFVGDVHSTYSIDKEYKAHLDLLLNRRYSISETS